MSSVEATWRWVLVTAIAPVAWGSTYVVIHHVLPPGDPLWGAEYRALPAALLLLLLSRRLPRGEWWWRSLVLGTLTVGAFFALVYVAAQLLPASLASTVMATSPVVMAAVAWALLGERPPLRRVAGSLLGIAGVVLMLATAVSGVDRRGVLASAAALLMSCFGYVLAKRWGTPEGGVLALTSWQMLAGGLVLLPVAVVVDGAPPVPDGTGLVAFAYLSVVCTALASVAWFSGLARLDAGTVGLIGLLNPVAGVLLGTLVAGEVLTVRQGIGLVLVGVGLAVGQATRARRKAGSVPVPTTLPEWTSAPCTAPSRAPSTSSGSRGPRSS